MNKKLMIGFLTILTIVLFPMLCMGQESKQPLRVGISDFEPITTLDANGKPIGFDIDLWEEAAKRRSITYEYVFTSREEKMENVKAGLVDIAIGGITMTPERERNLDFGVATFDSDIGVVTLNKTRELGLINELLETMSSDDYKKLFSWFTIAIIVIIILYYLAEKDKSIPKDMAPISWDFRKSGIEKAGVVVTEFGTTIGSGSWEHPHTRRGFYLALLAFAVFSLYLGSIIGIFSSATTTGRTKMLETNIIVPADIQGKVVASKKGTFSVNVARQFNVAEVKEFETIEGEISWLEQAYQALLNGEAEAIIYDKPGLLKFVNDKGRDKVRIVPGEMKPHYLAFAYPTGSELREEMNRALLELYMDGTYDKIYAKWFGER